MHYHVQCTMYSHVLFIALHTFQNRSIIIVESLLFLFYFIYLLLTKLKLSFFSSNNIFISCIKQSKIPKS